MTATFKPRPDLIQVTYQFFSNKLIDPEKKAKSIALDQTTGSWNPLDAAGKKKLAKSAGVVLGIDEKTHVEGHPYEYHLTIGFPPANTEGDIPTLLAMIFGRISLEGTVRLDSVELPEIYLKNKGPRFGIPGLRDKLNEPEKPLSMAVFKPCMGLSPGELGSIFFELACGGMHLIRDDEILPDLSTCPTEERLAACLLAAEKAKKETGQTTLYAVNLTESPSKIVAKAKRLAKEGATCFLLNVLSYGYGVLEELRGVGVPLLAHPALTGALCSGTHRGMSYAVALGTLMRFAGADIVLFPSGYGSRAMAPQDGRAIKEKLTWTMGGLSKSFPVPMGGIHPGVVPKILQDFGLDVIIHTGGAVQSHPNGPRAGGKAFRQAIDWTIKRGNLAGVSQREFPELAEALRLWGKSSITGGPTQ